MCFPKYELRNHSFIIILTYLDRDAYFPRGVLTFGDQLLHRTEDDKYYGHFRWSQGL